MADDIGQRELSREEQAKVWAFNDAKLERQGQTGETTCQSLSRAFAIWRTITLPSGGSKRAASQPTRSIRSWRPSTCLRPSFGDRAYPCRFPERTVPTSWMPCASWTPTGHGQGSRGASGWTMSWAEIQRKFGGRSKGLSDATTNRHMATLSAFWKWAEEREYCDGRNPFDGHRRNLKEGRNKRGYVAWETVELQKLFSPPPKRDDLAEIMLVALLTGMRLNEIVSLTNRQVADVDGVPCIDITDAKTTAGIRKVPLHPRLMWLAASAPRLEIPLPAVWSRFSDEGPGRQPSGDAGKEFGRFKRSRGFEEQAEGVPFLPQERRQPAAGCWCSAARSGGTGWPRDAGPDVRDVREGAGIAAHGRDRAASSTTPMSPLPNTERETVRNSSAKRTTAEMPLGDSVRQRYGNLAVPGSSAPRYRSTSESPEGSERHNCSRGFGYPRGVCTQAPLWPYKGILDRGPVRRSLR